MCGSAGAGQAIEVVSSSREAVRLAVGDLVSTWHEVTGGAGNPIRYDLQLPGFSTGGSIGGPRVPTCGSWLIVPPGTRPVLSTLSETWSPVVDRTLAIEPVPVIHRGVESFDTGVSEIMVLPGQEIPDGYEVPAGARAAFARRAGDLNRGAATLGEVVWWRGRQVVSVRLTGVQADGAGRASQVLVGGAWEVRFVRDKSATAATVPAVQARRFGTRNDDRFGGAFLNAELLDQTASEAAYRGVERPAAGKAAGARGARTGSLLGFESRLAVTKTKLHRVTYASLRSRNLLPDVPIQESEIRLYQRRYVAALDDGSGGAPYAEVEVPVHMVGEGDAFDGDDFFVFHGLRLRDDVEFTADLGQGLVTIPGAGDPFEQNNEANFYWLAASAPEPGVPWARMASVTLPAATGTPLASYRRSEHVEEQQAFRENLPNVQSDRLYYNNYRATEVTAAVNPLYSPDPAGANFDLRVGISGFSNSPRPLRFELITGTVTTPVEDYSLAGMGEVVRVFSLPPALIDGASTRVRMTSTNVALPTMFAHLNWVEISYDALYRATNNRVDFNLGAGAGERPVQVSGFGDADLGLYEITDPRQPVHVQLTAQNIVADGSAWRLSVMPDQTAGQSRRFFAVGSAGTTGIEEYVSFRSVAALAPAVPTDLAGGAPDLVVVSHPDFREALNRWVDHRVARSGGQLRVHVVDVQDLYDWYSGGLRDAWAI
jgi:hypothetical protein